MPEMSLSVRLGLYLFIALMIGGIVLYHYLTDPPRKAGAGGPREAPVRGPSGDDQAGPDSRAAPRS